MMGSVETAALGSWADGLTEPVEDRHALAALAAAWFAPVDPAAPGAALPDPAGPASAPAARVAGPRRSAGQAAFDTLDGVPLSVAEELSAIWLLLRTISLTDFGGLQPPLTSREFAALHLLQTTGPLRVIDVGELLRMDKSTTSRVVRSMFGRGLLDRARHPTDGRAFLVELTESGRQVVRDAVAARELALTAVLSQWDERARSALLAALLRLRREWSSLMPERWQGAPASPTED